MPNPSVMKHQFSLVPSAQIPRSSFDRSSNYKTTFNAGLLIPIWVDEALPGDTFSLSMTGFCRLSTPLKPVMDNIFMNTFFFFVPNRLIWDNWQRFNGEQTNPGDSTDFLVPEVIADGFTGFAPLSMGDYFGLPVGIPDIRVSALHFRAYNLIWNEWFRDENLQAQLTVPRGDGPDDPTLFTLQRRGKRHDYFTSSLPWPQKGESVSIPLGTSAPIYGTGAAFPIGISPMSSPTDARPIQSTTAGNNALLYGGAVVGASPESWTFTENQQQPIYADLSLASAATINQLRQAFAIQRLYERDARGGTRYTEIVRSHFGVVSPDARLQRPEYLGGGQSTVNITPVSQTSASGQAGADTPQGNLAAYGTSHLHGHGFSKSFTEHGVLLGLLSVRADLNYQQGLHRMWSRRGRFDFYWPALSHIGEQSVLSQELFCDGSADDQTVWGYQERYAEYRYKPSIVTGEFRSTYAQPLDVWHLALDFAARPLLNAAFIQDDPPIARVVAVPSEPHFIGDFYFRCRAARPMPTYGVPGLIDHF